MKHIFKTGSTLRGLFFGAIFLLSSAGILPAQAVAVHFETMKTMPGLSNLKPMSEVNNSGGSNDQVMDAPVMDVQGSVESPVSMGGSFPKTVKNEWSVMMAERAPVKYTRIVKRQPLGPRLEKGWQQFSQRARKFFHHKKCKTCPDW